jgi:hypothetical protein
MSFVIAAGFMLRLLAGTSGIGVEPSQWLLACGFLLTLFLGFAKRRAELARLAEDAAQHRAVLDAYTTGFLDKAILVCVVGMVVTYAAYTVSPDTASLHGTRHLIVTLPWVLLGHVPLSLSPAFSRRRRRPRRGGDARSDPRRVGRRMDRTVLWLIA